MFPTENSAKNYRVKAEIIATWDEWEETNSNGDSTISRQRAYYITKAYMPNGGTINFEDYEKNDPLELDKKIYASDDNDREWYVELTTEKVK